MRSSALFFLLTSLLLFVGLHGQTRFTQRAPNPVAKVLPGLPTHSGPIAGLWKAMVTGDDSGISKELKTTYFQVGLGHLFTPSGAHLASLSPLWKLLRLGSWPFVPLAFVGVFIPGLLALSRVAWLKALQPKRRGLWLFCLILVLEGALYSWRAAPLSWVCSWLFLGLTYFAPRHALIVWYLLGQMLLSWIFHQSFSLLTMPAAIVIGLPLIALFPIVLLSSFVPWSPLHEGVFFLLTKLNEAVHALVSLHTWLPPLELHAGHLLFSLALILLPGHLKKLSALGLLLLATPTGPWQRDLSESSRWEFVPAPHARIASVTHKQQYSTSRWSDGTSCRHQLVLGVWKETCRAKKSLGRRRKTKKLSSER